ncbi:MAG: type II secretion system F family protein [Acidimicrobiales bacterium]
MIALIIAGTGSLGLLLILTSRTTGSVSTRVRGSSSSWLAPGLRGLPLKVVRLSPARAARLGAAAMAAGLGAMVAFGSPALALVAALATAGFVASLATTRERRHQQEVASAWPALLEDVAMAAGCLGMSVPQALFEAGRRGPEELASAFAAAHRHWSVSTDFAASLEVLTTALEDPAADAAAETLLVAHEVGGNDLPRRLASLIAYRQADADIRAEADARQAGASFARRFVLIVPLGMALAGSAIGDGRAAYATATGQAAALAGVGLLAGCWFWSGRILAPAPGARVFGNPGRRSTGEGPGR